MAVNDVEAIQSLVRRYYNKLVKDHFQDIDGEDDSSLSLTAPRAAIKRLCLHKDNDPLVLTILRLLIYWVEARGLFNEIIYGIPADDLHETVVFKPQIAIHWRESIEDARTNNAYPARARYTVRYKGDVATKADIDRIRVKINNIFNRPSTHRFTKGKDKYSYRDKIKGYSFIITANSKADAVDVINKLLEIQDDNPLEERFLTKSVREEIPTNPGTVRVDGELHKLPKIRRIARVKFTHAELKVHGMTRDILLTNNLGVRIPAGVDN